MEKKKLLVIVSSEEKSKISVGINLAINSKKNDSYEDVRLFFFGPSEKVVAEDKEVGEAVSELIRIGINPYACVFLSDGMEVTPRLKDLGINVVGISKEIADAINSGYVPLVF